MMRYATYYSEIYLRKIFQGWMLVLEWLLQAIYELGWKRKAVWQTSAKGFVASQTCIVIQQNLAFAPLNYACITPYAQTTLLCSNDGGITWTCLLATHVSVTCHRAVWNLTGSDAHCYSAEGSQSEKRWKKLVDNVNWWALWREFTNASPSKFISLY